MSLTRAAFRVHRVLSYAVFAQVLAWVLGGVLFSWLPFDSVVKGGAYVEKPAPVIAGDLRHVLDGVPEGVSAVTRIESFASPRGPALRLRHAGGVLHVSVAGESWQAPDSAAIAAWAAGLYRGPGTLARVERLDRAPLQLGIVRETGERHDVWCAHFADALHTRLYFDGPSGEFLNVRNAAWVVYDLFFRLHVMDYGKGEDFNNPLLRLFAVTALGFALSGTVLSFAAARRALRARR